MPYTIIAIVPPEAHAGYLRILQREWNCKYGAPDVLKYPPHITLKSLGEVGEKSLERVYHMVSGAAKKTEPLSISIDGIRFFGTNEDYPGIYLNVEKSKELQRLHEMLARKLREFEDKPRPHKELDNYNPHITILGKDIGRDAYEKAKKEIGELNWKPDFSFYAKKICVVEKKEGAEEYWISKEFGLV